MCTEYQIDSRLDISSYHYVWEVVQVYFLFLHIF